jgi:hypothetical protein
MFHLHFVAKYSIPSVVRLPLLAGPAMVTVPDVIVSLGLGYYSWTQVPSGTQ